MGVRFKDYESDRRYQLMDESTSIGQFVMRLGRFIGAIDAAEPESIVAYVLRPNYEPRPPQSIEVLAAWSVVRERMMQSQNAKLRRSKDALG